MPLFNDNDPDEAVATTTIRIKQGVIGRLDRIAKMETDARREAGKKPPVVSRNDVIARFLELACDDYEKREGTGEAPVATAREKKKR
jgi:hypothetical protein